MTARADAERLADELGCEVVPYPRITGSVEARNPAPGVYVIVGTAAEVRAACLQARKRGKPGRKPGSGTAGLTPRQREVAELAAQGTTVAEIAGKLFVAASTVRAHLEAVYRKTGAGNRVQLLNWLAGHPPG